MAKGRPNDAPPVEEVAPMFANAGEPIRPVEPKPPEVKTADVVKPKPTRSPDAEFALMSSISRRLAKLTPAARKRVVGYLASRHAEEEKPEAEAK